ncbi:Cytochrome P450 52A13 [Yarrowia sp. C11]|nr:Cytochrome P450 52A13 [Yarrowia sp. C11]
MIILYVLAVAVSFLIFKRVTYNMRSRELAKKWNCEEPHNLNEFPFNLPLFFLVINASRKHELLDTLLGLFRTFAPTKTVKQVLLGSFTVIPTNDPENIKAVLATQFKDFCLGQRHGQLAPVLGDGIFTLDGQGWQHSRAMLRPQFARDQVSDVEMIERHVQHMLLRIPNNKKFDIQELFFNLTLDTATEFLFGQTVGSQTVEMADEDKSIVSDMPKDMRKSFQEDFNTAQHHGGIRTRFQMFYWLWRPSELFSSSKRVHAFVDHYVEKALATADEEKTDDKYIFLRELAREVKDPRVLRDQSLNILLAGRDTTAGILSWIVYELARHPEVWKKLRAEIHQDFGDGTDLSQITFEGLKRCEYLRFVINETLRLYPSVPLNVRYASRDTTLPRGGGPDESKPILVRKGDTIVYNVFSMHRTEEFWGKDCDEFRPERWAEKGSRGWEYLPFNGGPRICLGQQYALTETSYVIARICQLFTKIENADTAAEPPQKLHALTMCHLNGVFVKMTRDEAVFAENEKLINA